jgi:hypothetical protein
MATKIRALFLQKSNTISDQNAVTESDRLVLVLVGPASSPGRMRQFG